MKFTDKLRADELPGERQQHREARIVLRAMLDLAAQEIDRLDGRVGDLLKANNDYLERARKAEKQPPALDAYIERALIRDITKAIREGQILILDYTNWRDERRTRKVLPQILAYRTSAFHDGVQWFLGAIDIETGSNRDFALAGIHDLVIQSPEAGNV